MARTTIINSDPFCDVRMHNIEDSAGEKTDKYMVEMQLPDSNEYKPIPGVGVVHGNDYQLVTNSQVRDMVTETISASGLSFKPLRSTNSDTRSHIYWNGRRFSQKWYCPDANIPAPGGSSMMLGLEAINSYDGSCKVGLAFFAMHVVCSNQFYSNNILGRPFEFVHVNRGGELEDDIDDALDQIKLKASSFSQITPYLNRLKAAEVRDFDDFLQIRRCIKDETGCEIRDKQLLDELSGHGVTANLGLTGVKYNNPSSFWNIANAYTAITTHAVGGPRGSDQSSRVLDWLINEATNRV